MKTPESLKIQDQKSERQKKRYIRLNTASSGRTARVMGSSTMEEGPNNGRDGGMVKSMSGKMYCQHQFRHLRGEDRDRPLTYR